MKEKERERNSMEEEEIGKLILKFAIPAIISGLVGALYNIVDQIFIGRYVGMLGNAATNVAFPITTISTSISLLIGVGSSSNFSLHLGRKEEREASRIATNGISLMMVVGIIIGILGFIFLNPLLKIFGATEKVMPYAQEYTRIIVLGLPFFIFGNAGSYLIRADGNPVYAMVSTSVGAVLNVFLDALFIIKFDMGMAGAAWATIIGQVVSALVVVRYLLNFKTVELKRMDLRVKFDRFKAIVALGASACFNQLALTVFQIVMNNSLGYYGALSKYGSEIPLASVGIISKVYVIFISVVVGISQGAQPIFGYNYGAEAYDRVKETYSKALRGIMIFSIACFLAFQIFPRQIIGIFGDGDELYYQFGIRYFRIFLFMIFLNGIQPLTGNFFSAIGKAKKGIFVSLTRQILFLVPLIIILPRFFGIDGIMFAGPIADFVSAVLALVLVKREMEIMDELERNLL